MHIDIQRDRARTMRKHSTNAETILWSRLRNRALAGYRFHRQMEIGPYIADFACRERAVLVEIDGDTHSDPLAIKYDQARTSFLEAKGFVVFRVWNMDVYKNLDTVLEGLCQLLITQAPRFQKRRR